MTRPLRRRFRGFSESHELARHVDIATSLPEVSAIYDTDNQTPTERPAKNQKQVYGGEETSSALG